MLTKNTFAGIPDRNCEIYKSILEELTYLPIGFPSHEYSKSLQLLRSSFNVIHQYFIIFIYRSCTWFVRFKT